MDLDHTIVASSEDLVAIPSQHSNGLVVGRDTVVQQTIEPNPTQCAVHLSCDDASGEGEGFSHISIIYIRTYVHGYIPSRAHGDRTDTSCADVQVKNEGASVSIPCLQSLSGNH